MQGPPLNLAMMEDKLDAVTVLLEHGADPSFCWRQKMILEWAIEWRNRNMVKAMLEIPSSKRICLERLKVKRCTLFAPKLKDSTCHVHTPLSGLIAKFPGW